MDYLPGVTVPELVFGFHPLWHRTTLRAEPLVLSGIRFPRDTPQPDCLDLCTEILIINDRGVVVVGDERGAPDLEELIYEVLRELGLKV